MKGLITTLGKVNDAKEALQRLGNVKLPIKQSYSISKLINLINPELINFQLQHKKLLEGFGVEKDGMIICKSENINEFQKQYKELCNIEVKIDWSPIELESIEITAIDLIVLEPFLIVKLGEN